MTHSTGDGSNDGAATGEAAAALRARLLSESADDYVYETVQELSSEGIRAHQRAISGDTSLPPTQLRVRLFGEGVLGHRIPVDQAAPILRELQMAATWIGSRLRNTQGPPSAGWSDADAPGVRYATQMFLEPQIEAGSIIFILSGRDTRQQEEPGLFEDLLPPQESILDDSLRRLLATLSIADEDVAGGALTREVQALGGRAASALNRLAVEMTDNRVSLDVSMRSRAGLRSRASLHRRGALALSDAVTSSRSTTKSIVLRGRLETASLGRDPVRVVTPDRDVRLSVNPDGALGLGRLLGRNVVVQAEETTISRESGEVRTYHLESIRPADT